MRGLMHWQYLTISRGGTSIVEQLQRDFPEVDPFEYVSFYSLRTHEGIGLPIWRVRKRLLAVC